MNDRERQKWIEFINKMVEIYGVTSYLDNLEEDSFFDTEDIWFTCPECGDIVYAGDWELDEIREECPICGFDYGTYFDKE